MYLGEVLDQIKVKAVIASSTLGWIVFLLGFWMWSSRPDLFWRLMRILRITLIAMLRHTFIAM
jgi:hypothetical protein